MFNFQYIKNLATPGSWRRGYEYYRTNQVLDAELQDNTVIASVKGNFQDKYNIKLNFTPEKVSAQCDCPLEEEWCKHATAVGLVSISKHFYENYLTETTGQEFKFEDENPPEITDYQGGYKFILNTKFNPKFISIQVIDRAKDEKVVDIEAILRAVVALQNASNGAFELNNIQKYELAALQHIYKTGRAEKKLGLHSIPINKLEETLKFLSQVEEVIDYESSQRLVFKKTPWQLILTVNVSLVGNVLLSLHWKRPEPEEDIYPLEEVKYFAKYVKWGRYKNLIVPLDTALSTLPHYLTRSTFTDIRDADGGKFVYEELPKLKDLMTVEISETLERLTLEQKPPAGVISIELTEEKAIKASLDFEYDGMVVPYGKLAEKTPYVTIKKPEEEIIYWVKRNLEKEEKAYKFLLSNKFHPTQTNNVLIEGDDAIDFYNEVLPKLLKNNWKVVELNDFSSLKVASNPLKIHVDIDFDDSVDSFSLEISCAVRKTEIDLDTVQYYLQQGKKYFYLEKEGYVEVPLADILQFTRSLNYFDAQKAEDRRFTVKTFRAGLVADLMDQQVAIKMSRKFKKFWDQISTFNTMEDVELPNIQADLREYQKKGFNWLWFLYSYGLNGILADDMGLGKTLQALTLIQKAKEKHGKEPTLVICPTSVVFNWEAEIEKFAPKLTTLNLTGSARKDLFSKIDKRDVVITSYALLRRDIEELKRHNFRFVILDESQNIKNYESVTAQSAKQLNASHRLALSGTPIENRLSELWSVFDFLMPGFLYDIEEFDYRYANPIEDRGDRSVESRLKKQIYPFILRRMKRDIAKDLPDKIESIAYCHMTPEQRDFYLDVLDSTREEIFSKIAADGIEKNRMSIFAALLRLRQICNHPRLFDKEGKQKATESGKFEHMKEMLEEIISEGHRILLFSQFVQMLEIIKEWLEEKGIRYEYLTGETKAEDRPGKVNRFNSDESIPIFLISLKAGGTGLNLTGADYVIHYDPWWNPAVEDQATDRAHRIGQTKKVFVYKLITKGSVEEKIMKLKERKRDLADTIISIDRSIGKSLTYEDLKDILTPDL